MPFFEPLTKQALFVVSMKRPLPETLLRHHAPTGGLPGQGGIALGLLFNHRVCLETATLRLANRCGRNRRILPGCQLQYLGSQSFLLHGTYVRANAISIRSIVRETMLQ